jgi:site-specific recombinase XerD
MVTEWPNWHDQRRWDVCLREIEKAEIAYQPLLHAFVEWSCVDRGLQPCTIHHGVYYSHQFLDWIARGEEPFAALGHLTLERIESFFIEVSRDSGYAKQRDVRTAVCRFLRFAGQRGWTDPHLVDGVPGLRVYRLAHVVRGISDDQIRQLFSSLPDARPVDVRDRAILAMLAVYGARSGHLTHLRFEHVQWKQRQILLPAHKGGKPILHILLPQVARLLARYVRECRPPAPFEEIFLTSHPPYTPLTAVAVSSMVHHRLSRAGIETASTGAHIFRHAFATRLLRHRHSLKTIADLLGHRDLCSVAIYTKVDEPSLREVAARWPEVME